MNFYMSTIQMEPPSFIIFEISEKNVCQTFDLGLRSNFMPPNGNLYMYMDSYISRIQIKTLSLVFFEIFMTKVYVTFDLGSRSNVIAPNESSYMISYMSTIQLKPLSYIIIFKIFETIASLTFMS